MQILVERDAFADAVAWTARALPARPTVPVLAGMRLHAEDGDLTLSSFDYDVSALATIPVDAEAPGSALVSGKLLAEISRSLPGRPVQISSEGGRAVVTCGSATFNLLTMPEEEYPALPEMPPAAGTVGSDAFATGLAMYVLAQSPSKDVHEPLLRARDFLVKTQQADGSWLMKSRPAPPPGPGPARYLTPIRYWGTAWATIGLVQPLPK